MLYDQMGLEFPNYQSYDLLARSFGRISVGKSPPLERKKKNSYTAVTTLTPNYSDENETLKSLSMTESHYSSNMMSSPTKSVSSVKSYTKKKRRRSSAAKKEIEFVRSVSSGSSGIESMSSLDGHSTSSPLSSSSKEDGLSSDRYNSVSIPTGSMTIGMRRQIDKLMVAIEG
ncbi:unnamed protein product [Oikopleura dioica]|uniref:Uncharacterized protein n=1 Tax=Oikopleura dioica TaxID=34765 RepID=E4WZ35_OIKDI|nr:unnamed protein product [Oikopleura dioica]